MVASERPLRAVPATEPASVLLTTEQAFDYLKARGAWPWSLSTFFDWLAADAIPHVRVKKGRYALHRSELDDWIANGRTRRWREASPDPALAALVELVRGMLDGSVEARVTLTRPGGHR